MHANFQYRYPKNICLFIWLAQLKHHFTIKQLDFLSCKVDCVKSTIDLRDIEKYPKNVKMPYQGTLFSKGMYFRF